MSDAGSTVAPAQPQNPRPTHIQEPTTTHMQTIILLHGLGNNHTYLLPLLTTPVELPSKSESGSTTVAGLSGLLPGARFILPNAPLERSTVFRRKKVTQWFDIAVLGEPYRDENKGGKQCAGLARSVGRILRLVDDEAEAVGYGNVFILGVSMGMALGTTVMMSLGRRIGGFIGLSGWVPFGDDMIQVLGKPPGSDGESQEPDDAFATHDENKGDDGIEFEFEEEEKNSDTQQSGTPFEAAASFERETLQLGPRPIHRTATTTPVFISHGSADEKIAESYGEDAVELFRAAGFQVTWNLYDGLTHRLPDDAADIFRFLVDALGHDQGPE